MKKLLYTGQDLTLFSELQNRLDGRYGLHRSVSGPEATEDFLAFLPDVLVADAAFPGCDTIGLLRIARTRAGQTRVIVLTGGHISGPLQQIGPDAVLMHPVSAEELVRIIEAGNNVTAHDRIEGILQRLGFCCGNEGVTFVRDAIIYKADHPTALFTSDLCVHVAKQNNTTAQSVDKTMSRSIRRAWKNRNPVLWASYVPDCNRTVTCNAFINAVCSYLKQKDESIMIK